MQKVRLAPDPSVYADFRELHSFWRLAGDLKCRRTQILPDVGEVLQTFFMMRKRQYSWGFSAFIHVFWSAPRRVSV